MIKKSFPLPFKTIQVNLQKGVTYSSPLPQQGGEEEKHSTTGWEKEQTVPLHAPLSSSGPNESTCLSANTAELILKCYALERK